MISLGVLDEVPVFRDGTAAASVMASIELAKAVEACGYDRFWLGEQHGLVAHGCASPAVLAAAVAAGTSTIRVGSGALRLSLRHPLAVAEEFRLLAALHPDRVDLGVDRTAGGSAALVAALQPLIGVEDPAEAFTQRLGQLLAFLGDSRARTRTSATPQVEPGPQPLLLGSDPATARIAGMLGLPFCFAQYAVAKPDTEPLEAYRATFRPSPWLARPQAMVALRVLCAETQQRAEDLAAPFWMTRGTGWRAQVQPRDGYRGGAPSLDDAARYRLTDDDRQMMADSPMLQLVGDPRRMGAKVVELAGWFEVDEVMVLTSCPDLAARQRSYQLLIEHVRTGQVMEHSPAHIAERSG